MISVAVAVLLCLFGAGKEARTPDIHVGNVVLYQLSYARIKLVPHDRIELPSQDYKTSVLPLY